MDALSRILDNVDMRGSLYYTTEFRAPWGLRVPAEGDYCRFHVVVEGTLHLSLEDESVELGRGDLALVTGGRGHLLQDALETPLTELEEAYQECGFVRRGAFRWGGGGALCRLVCGHFAFDQEAPHPLLARLPPLVHVAATPTWDFGWIDRLTRLLSEEAHSPRPGSEVISRRISEVLLVQVIRHCAETMPERVPVLAGFTDPRLSRALGALHEDLGQSWTVEELARRAGMSRTAFSTRFTELIGATPIKYLTAERMREATRLVRAGESVARIAERVGYLSEAAFARKFKESIGLGPGAYRRRAAAAGSRARSSGAPVAAQSLSRSAS